MSLFNALDVSGSGLSAERLRMDVTAENLANAQTTRGPNGGPYHRKTVVLEQAGGGFGSSLAGAMGGGSGLMGGAGGGGGAGPGATLLAGEALAGEARDGNPLLNAVELDEDAARTQQMLDQVSTLVKDNPDAAASLVKRWMNRD